MPNTVTLHEYDEGRQELTSRQLDTEAEAMRFMLDVQGLLPAASTREELLAGE